MTKLPTFDDHIAPLEAMLTAAKAAGATSADVLISEDSGLSVGVRMNKLEKCEQATSAALGLRVFIGQQSATIATNDLHTIKVKEFAERAVTMARVTPADEFSGLADPSMLAKEVYPIDSVDPDFTLDAAQLQRWCEEAEDTGLAAEGITNSDGAEAGAGHSRFTLMASTGFAASRETTYYSLYASLLSTGADGRMMRDYDYSSAIYQSDLRAPAEIGRRAAINALRLRGAQVAETMKDIPVVFEARVASSLLSHFLGAINGSAIALKRSFLSGKLGETIFNKNVTILDEPHLLRGLRSRPFDAEGLPTRPMALVQNGVLQHYLLNQHAARQLNMMPTGHAVRGAASQPGISASNVSLVPGLLSPEELRHDIKKGLYVTEFIGSGVNPVTGDYSRGAAGFLIENGELTQPVTEVTIASTLQHMFAQLVAGNDLVRETGVDSPSLRVDGMTLAGR